MNDEVERFRENLVSSLPSVAAVAGYFIKARRFDVVVPHLHVPKTKEDYKSDGGDIFLQIEGKGDAKIVEVKSYDYDMDALDNFPIVIVDRCDIYDFKEYKPDLYFAVCRDLDEALMFNPAKDWDSVTTHQFKDKVTGKLLDCYVAPREKWKRVRL